MASELQGGRLDTYCHSASSFVFWQKGRPTFFASLLEPSTHIFTCLDLAVPFFQFLSFPLFYFVSYP